MAKAVVPTHEFSLVVGGLQAQCPLPSLAEVKG
jgi:hypothetical protein